MIDAKLKIAKIVQLENVDIRLNVIVIKTSAKLTNATVETARHLAYDSVAGGLQN